MTTQELNIAKALLITKEILSRMISEGLSDSKMVFYVSNMLSDKYNLTKDESLIVIENAMKLC